MGNKNSTEIPPTILPLNKVVKVHLVPKFLTSDGTRFDSRYCMMVKVTELDSVLDKQSSQPDLTTLTQLLSANVEFRQRRFSLVGNSKTNERNLRTRSVTLKHTDIEVKQVVVNKEESIRISGTFLRGLADLKTQTFDLILCPSQLINTADNKEWLLMGTLYTKAADSKHEHRWRAAVRASLD